MCWLSALVKIGRLAYQYGEEQLTFGTWLLVPQSELLRWHNRDKAG